MGASVIIAIKHDRTRLFTRQYARDINLEMNLNDGIPKFYNSTPVHNDGSHHFRTSSLRDLGIAVSHYHDNDQRSTLIINHDFLLGLQHCPNLSWDKIEDEASFSRQLKTSIKKARYPFNQRFWKGLAFSETDKSNRIRGESPISLFMVQTDTLSDALTLDNMQNLLAFCENGFASSLTFGCFVPDDSRRELMHYSKRIDYLGTLDRNSAAIISLSCGLAKLVRVPNRKIEMNLESNSGLEKFDKYMEIRNSAFQAVLSSFGVVFSRENKKDHTLDIANGL